MYNSLLSEDELRELLGEEGAGVALQSYEAGGAGKSAEPDLTRVLLGALREMQGSIKQLRQRVKQLERQVEQLTSSEKTEGATTEIHERHDAKPLNKPPAHEFEPLSRTETYKQKKPVRTSKWF